MEFLHGTVKYFSMGVIYIMREPYGSFVEFISSYNWGGIVESGFGNLQMELMFDRQNKGMKLW